MKRFRVALSLLPIVLMMVSALFAAPPRALPEGERPQDRRLGELKNLNGYFPFQTVDSVPEWEQRQAEIRRRILVSQGLWPLPEKTPLNAVIHGRVERDDYVVDRVFFESLPGHYVTGSLYRPKDRSGPFPAILSPHGHWNNGRFYDAGERAIREQIAIGAERFESGARSPLQARAVQLARMGCLVFHYDMTGYADSIQLEHRPAEWAHLDRPTDWGFMSAQAELRLQNMMGLQTWNSIRAIDFVLSLEDVDPERIGVTGASGGGTQSMILGPVDGRIAAAMPCVMVSTAMQGGCTCENAPLLRIDQGNIDIAAAIAPRPLGVTAADDWTVELETKGYPDLRGVYEMLGHPDRLTAVFHTEFKHNYNHVNRTVMYGFFNRHFHLGFEEPVLERDFVPLTREEATVWTDEHPAPSGDQVGDAHQVRLLKFISEQSEQQMQSLVPATADELSAYRRIIGGAWETILGRRLNEVGSVESEEIAHSERGGSVMVTALVNHVQAGEQVPALALHPGEDRWNHEVVLWFTDTGKAGILDGEEPIAPVRRLLEAGFAVASADLFGQGEFAEEGQPLESQRMWNQRDGRAGWHRFAGYTYGYNHPVFVKRVHDVLSLIRAARDPERDADAVHLVGIGSAAGAVVAAARSQAGDAVTRTFIDTRGFRFQSLTRHDDPMFVPGAVKYGDVDGLLSLCAPHQVHIAGEGTFEISAAVYAAAGAADALQRHPQKSAADVFVED